MTASLLDQPKLYYNIDGVGELGIGFMGLAYSLLLWMQIHSPKDSAWNRPLLTMFYFCAMSAIIHWGSKAIKTHITYPRTGFVEYRMRDKVWRPMMIGFVASALFSAGLLFALRSHWDVTTPASLIGLIFAGSYARGFAKQVRWKWSIVYLMMLGSLTIALLPADVIGAVAEGAAMTALFPAKVWGAILYSFLLFGALLSISGGITMWSYLRRTAAPGPESL